MEEKSNLEIKGNHKVHPIKANDPPSKSAPEIHPETNKGNQSKVHPNKANDPPSKGNTPMKPIEQKFIQEVKSPEITQKNPRYSVGLNKSPRFLKSPTIQELQNWTEEDVYHWALISLKIKEQDAIILKNKHITGQVLLDTSELSALGLPMLSCRIIWSELLTIKSKQ